MLVGYDKAQKAYRATCVDNFGTLMPYHGTLTGNKLVLESPEEMNLMGQKSMERLTFDKGDGTYKLTREQKIAGGTWKVLENAVIQATSQQASR